MTSKAKLIGGAGALALAAAGAAALAQGGGGPVTYWMSAGTTSGLAAMGAGRPNAASMMGAMFGGGGNAGYSRTLTLQLGSPRKAAGAPTAEHLPPAALQAGASLPLVTPEAQRAVSTAPTGWTGEKPKGRMLIYWGCGERARAGQPLVVDFAALASGKAPPALAAAALKAMTPPSPATHATYGEWPNQRSKTSVPARGSLIGEHVVRGNYTPEIRFSVAPGQDFLAPVTLTSNKPAASGSVPLAWRPVPGARAWFAAAMGAAENGDFVMWSSSEGQIAAMAYDYISDADLARLVTSRVLLPPTADRCTVPAEVAKAAPQSMLTVLAFGGESNFTQPKPAGAAASWRPEWTVKLRTKSSHMSLLGMNMAEMMGGSDDGGDEETQQQGEPGKKKKKRKIPGLPGGITF
jgi:hypothetical protein